MQTPENTSNDTRPVYAREDVLAAATAYFQGDTLAASVWLSKYALRDAAGNLCERTPDDMHRRLAAEIARVERRYANPLSAEEVYDLLRDFRFLVPQGSPMAGIGNPYQIISLSNCFVIGIEGSADSYGAIMKIDEEQVQLMKRRGGVGHDLSQLRPVGTPVRNSALRAAGILPFMARYANSTREVAQNGRRGALMLTLSVEHPDAPAFVDAKLKPGRLTGANISLRVTDAFMRAALHGGTFTLRFPVGAEKPLVAKEISATELWKKIIHNAWQCAEPGILFWDTVLRESVPDCYADLGFRTVSTNPCGEVPLCSYDSCRLLAINLLGYVQNPYTAEARFDFALFERHGRLAQRILDDILDLELEKIETILAKIHNDPEPEFVKSTERDLWIKIREKCIQGRRAGIGITGEGDLLAALGICYGAPESLNFSENLHRTLALAVYRGSVDLARERGAFPLYDRAREANNPFIQRLGAADPALLQDMQQYGRRNIALLTIAPTGTTSLMTQTSSGLEPVFRIAYTRRRKVQPGDPGVRIAFTDEAGDAWEEHHILHKPFQDWLETRGVDPETIANLPAEKLAALIEQS
ncbi:MAG: adenosylcobalamin-dependent ribonucleoside-diphosphate reductase, partial [Saprospiraceae bacterium]